MPTDQKLTGPYKLLSLLCLVPSGCSPSTQMCPNGTVARGNGYGLFVITVSPSRAITRFIAILSGEFGDLSYQPTLFTMEPPFFCPPKPKPKPRFRTNHHIPERNHRPPLEPLRRRPHVHPHHILPCRGIIIGVEEWIH